LLNFDVGSFFGAWFLVLGIFLWGLHSIVPSSFAFDVVLEIMKAIELVLTACAAMVLSGCATNQGAASDQYETTYGTSRGNPASPTFHPGMYPDDIRDPNSVTRHIEAPPTTPP
jgi:predicted small secreted protein